MLNTITNTNNRPSPSIKNLMDLDFDFFNSNLVIDEIFDIVLMIVSNSLANQAKINL